MEQNSTTSKTISGLIWRFAERCGAQLVSFFVSMVLARILEPSMYGTIALVTVITGILQIFVDSGLGTSLIQKKDADDTDFSTVFYVNMLMCIILYLGMYFAAPHIALFYEKNYLVTPIRVISLSLIISGVNNVQHAYVSRHMLFKRFFYSTLGSTVISAIVGIYMAYNGYGLWSIIAQDLTKKLMDAVILWFTVRWRPKLLFSFSRLKSLFSFGWKLLVSSLIDKLYLDCRQLIIGKMYSDEALAFYNKGKQIPDLVVNNINTSIDSVLLPVMSSEQDNRERIKAMARRSIKTSCFILMPIMFGVCAVARPLILLMLTEKWSEAIPFLMVFCISDCWRPIHTANLNAIKAMGRSDIFLLLEVIKKGIGIAFLLATMRISPFAMAASTLASTVINGFVNAFPNRKLLGYGYFEQIKDILPTLLLSSFMCLAVMSINLLNLPNIITLIIQVPLGVLIYVCGAKLFKFEMFDYTLNLIKKFFNK